MLFVAGESAGKGEEAVLRWGSMEFGVGVGVGLGDVGTGKPGFADFLHATERQFLN